jgi:hypothetical protein
MRSVLARSCIVAACSALLLGVSAARAHDVIGTVIYVDLGHTSVHLEVELPVDELRLAFGMSPSPGIAELPASGAELAAYVRAHVALRTPDGRPFSLRARAGDVIVHDARNWQEIELDAEPPPAASAREFVLTTDVINHRVVSHHIFVFLRRDLATGQLGEPVYLDTLHWQSHDVAVRRDPGSLGVGLWSVFRLGMSHIAEGTDHLLFVFTLLLPAGLALGARRRWGARRSAREAAMGVVRIVTAFTVGHSITLLVGALGLLRLPSVWVESFIAASILVSALHAIGPLFPGREAWVALGFGLVHGLGFASALEGLGVDGTTLVLTVLGFNLGVECMQALLVVVTLPWVFLLQGTRLGPALRQLGGGLAFVVALAWLAQRALGIQVPLLDQGPDATLASNVCATGMPGELSPRLTCSERAAMPAYV